MNAPIHLYTLHTADLGAQGFALALGQNLNREVVLLPLAQLPPPDVLRRQRLRCERVELLEALRVPGTDRTAIHQRLADIDQVLGQEGGPGRG
ncbi:hypothetical protein Q5H93_14840 [Hymenobacter sp. ASUV-10]|uniref:Uncharacterized protein n=1 Tax=Hymenobacter aranciens TaxID=3063996 RepID=A0ABT9BCP9_9BACT|nr:hypothetical protein [Hymenobacter sp. ASUV-10]MDO7876018.1 hypothetical protein [Hymenobacter sp. ASUV-10]